MFIANVITVIYGPITLCLHCAAPLQPTAAESFTHKPGLCLFGNSLLTYIPKVSQGVHFVCLNFYTKTDLFWLIKYWLTPFLEQLWTLFKFRVCVLLSQKVWNQCNNGYYFVWINGLRSVIFLNNNIALISSGLKIWLLIKEQFYASVKKCFKENELFCILDTVLILYNL